MSDFLENDICDIVQDILPLYHDGVCSEKSRMLVEKHVKTCPKCGDLLRKLETADADEAKLIEERQHVLAHHEKQEKTLAMKIGMIIAALLLLPIIIMLLVTLSGGTDFRSDVVLISSMLLVAGLTVVPLISKQNRFAKMIIVSILALLLVIFTTQQLFYHGSILEFFEIAFSVVFGLSIPFFPVILFDSSLPEGFQNKKGLITMIWDTVWFFLMMFTFGIAYPGALHDLIVVGSFGISLVWLIFLIVRYLPKHPLMKAGGVLLVIDAWFWLGIRQNWLTFEVGSYSGKILVAIYTTLALFGILLFIIGCIRSKMYPDYFKDKE